MKMDIFLICGNHLPHMTVMIGQDMGNKQFTISALSISDNK